MIAAKEKSIGDQAEPALAGLGVDPAPLALGAFALTTFLLSAINVGWLAPSAIAIAVATAWFYGGAVQVAVGFWELISGRLFAAVTFGSYGAFWLSFATYETFYADKIPAAIRGQATAIFLGVWAIFTLYMLIGSLKTNVALSLAFLLVELLILPVTYGLLTDNAIAIQVGGWMGILLALDVWYVATAEIINHQFKRQVLPLGSFR